MFTDKPAMKYMACWQLGVIDSHHGDSVGTSKLFPIFEREVLACEGLIICL